MIKFLTHIFLLLPVVVVVRHFSLGTKQYSKGVSFMKEIFLANKPLKKATCSVHGPFSMAFLSRLKAANVDHSISTTEDLCTRGLVLQYIKSKQTEKRNCNFICFYSKLHCRESCKPWKATFSRNITENKFITGFALLQHQWHTDKNMSSPRSIL